MGWDVTDFGSGDFGARGLLLLCTRNGIQGQAGERPYAEKLMVVRDGQETPFHFHAVKAEDIINRGGGDLVVEVTLFTGGIETTEPVEVLIDGDLRRLPPRSSILLAPGESITLTPGQMHRFYGRGIVLVGEVSQSNDDNGDNYFLEPRRALRSDRRGWTRAVSALDRTRSGRRQRGMTADRESESRFVSRLFDGAAFFDPRPVAS